MAVRRFQLHPAEGVLVDVRPHWSFLGAPLVVALVAVAVGIALDVGIPHTSVDLHWVEGVIVAIPCLWLAGRVVRWRRTSLVLTNQRIVVCWGAVARPRWEVALADVQRADVEQSFLRALVGTGRLELTLWNGGGVREIGDVRKPVVLQRVITRRLSAPAAG